MLWSRILVVNKTEDPSVQAAGFDYKAENSKEPWKPQRILKEPEKTVTLKNLMKV